MWLNQLALAPAAQRTGLAGVLFRTGLQWARDQGATPVGLDTAVLATHLVTKYQQWGYIERGTIHLEGKPYDSIVMTRPSDALARGLAAHRGIGT